MDEFFSKVVQCYVGNFQATCNDDLNPNIGLNKLFIQSSIHCMYSSDIGVISVPFDKNRLTNLLLFSLPPRSPKRYG